MERERGREKRGEGGERGGRGEGREGRGEGGERGGRGEGREGRERGKNGEGEREGWGTITNRANECHEDTVYNKIQNTSTVPRTDVEANVHNTFAPAQTPGT